MKRRINLYNPNKPKNKFELLSLSGSISVFAVIVILTFALGAGLSMYADSKKDEFERLKAAKSKLDVMVQTEQSRFQNLRVNSEIVAEQERIRSEIASRQQLQKLLYKVQPEQSITFSEYLYGLSASSMEDSWFNRFSIDTEKGLLTMEGAAVDGPSIPAMLESIGRVNAFRDMSIRDLNVQAMDSGVSFTAAAELRRYE